MNRPLISVNLTTYNRAHLLPRVLTSIQAQTWENLEVIVVDDCSTDDTADIIRRFQQQDKKIKYFRHESNRGNAFARNTALRQCRGQYVAFMDDDDEWIDRNKLSMQAAIFDQYPDLAIVCSNVKIYKSFDHFTKKFIAKPKSLKSHILACNGIIYNSTVMTRRSIMMEARGFDEAMPKGIDSEYYRTCIVKLGYDVYFMPEITTAVHEYGDDRITPVANKQSSYKALYANLYLIKKYFWIYVTQPRAFAKRLKNCLLLGFRYARYS